MRMEMVHDHRNPAVAVLLRRPRLPSVVGVAVAPEEVEIYQQLDLFRESWLPN